MRIWEFENFVQILFDPHPKVNCSGNFLIASSMFWRDSLRQQQWTFSRSRSWLTQQLFYWTTTVKKNMHAMEPVSSSSHIIFSILSLVFSIMLNFISAQLGSVVRCPIDTIFIYQSVASLSLKLRVDGDMIAFNVDYYSWQNFLCSLKLALMWSEQAEFREKCMRSEFHRIVHDHATRQHWSLQVSSIWSILLRKSDLQLSKQRHSWWNFHCEKYQHLWIFKVSSEESQNIIQFNIDANSRWVELPQNVAVRSV